MTSLLHKGAWHYYSHGEYVKHKNGVPREVSKLHQVVRLKVLAVQWEEEKTSTISLIDVPSLVHKVQYLNISFSPLELLFHAILMRFWLKSGGYKSIIKWVFRMAEALKWWEWMEWEYLSSCSWSRIFVLIPPTGGEIIEQRKHSCNIGSLSYSD